MDASTFAALGEPSRLEVVELLRSRPFPVGDIAEKLRIRQPQVSKHLRVLREAGVVAFEAVGRKRIYHRRGETFEEIGDWAGSFEALWEERLDALENVLASMDVAKQEEDR